MKQIHKLDGYELEEVIELLKDYSSYRKQYENKWNIVKKFHDGDMWKEIGRNLPSYFVKNDTNYLEYIEKAIKNSVYTGDFRATALARGLEDNEVAKQLNRFIDMTWDTLKFKTFMPRLGKNTILYNVSYIRVGWDKDKISGKKDKKYMGDATLEHVSPFRVFLDPSVTDLQKGQAVFIQNQTNINVLKKNPLLAEGINAYIKELEKKNIKVGEIPASKGILDIDNTNFNPKNKTITITEVFYRNGKGIDQIFIANNEYIVFYKKGIEPNKFPIVALYGELPDEGPYGHSMANKVLVNIIAYNMIGTLENTHIYSSQNRAKLISNSSGINWRSFLKHGNDPHRTWMVNGDPNQLIKYVDIPELPSNIFMTKSKIQEDIMMVTGVDLRYTGRDTGSIQTTGGTDLSQQRIIGQTDNSRISSMEHFVEETTALIIDYYKKHGDSYPIFKRDIIGQQVIDGGSVDDVIKFSDIKDIDFQFSLEAAPFLPANRLRIAQAATEILEAQAQYNMQVELISAEEWLMYQDFPQKELILARMQSDKQQNDAMDIENILMSFAGMIDQGMDPQEAIQTLVEEKQFLRQNPDIDSMTKA